MNIDRPIDTSRRRFLQVSGAVCLTFVGGAIADANTLLNNRSTNEGMTMVTQVSDPGRAQKPLHIDIPVKLAEVKAAFSVGALAFEGDLPASIFHLELIEKDAADWNAKAQVIAVFHTNAGHVTLNDKAYNAERKVATGNPYKDLIASLMKQGVLIELCGATAKAH